MSRTSDITSDVTDDGDRTPDSAEDGTFIEAPCREAARYIVACPRCGRQLQLKTLRYSHVCNRTFNVEERAMEQKQAAEAAARARMARLEHPQEQNAQVAHQREQKQERPAQRSEEQKRADYANLLII